MQAIMHQILHLIWGVDPDCVINHIYICKHLQTIKPAWHHRRKSSDLTRTPRLNDWCDQQSHVMHRVSTASASNDCNSLEMMCKALRQLFSTSKLAPYITCQQLDPEDCVLEQIPKLHGSKQIDCIFMPSVWVLTRHQIGLSTLFWTQINAILDRFWLWNPKTVSPKSLNWANNAK